MKAALFLALLLASGQGATAASAAPLTPQARLSLEPARVAVGEPFTLALELSDPSAFEPGAPDVDASWFVFSHASAPTPEGVRFTWELASLEAGERLLAFTPGPDLEAAPPAVRLRVASVLAEDETEPRPIRGLPDDFGQAVRADAEGFDWARLPTLLGVANLLALSVILALLLWKRRGGRSRAVARPSRLERFDALARGEADAHARHHAWAGLLREAVDARLGRAGSAWTDEEWLVTTAGDARLDAGLQARIASALTTCARVRFGGERPSAFAVEALQREVRALLVVLAGPETAPAAAPANDAGRAA